MPLDQAALGRGCGGDVRRADQLCRRELDRFKSALAGDAAITVGCTTQAPLFAAAAREAGAADRIAYANIRENAGWSDDATAAGPKMAALLAAAGEPAPPVASVSFESSGVALIYGRDDVAIEAARRLAEHLDITVLLTRPGEIAPPEVDDFPIVQGTIAAATGHLGNFTLQVDDYALPAPSSRHRLVFGPARNGATSTCDVILDLSGGTPLFTAHDLRAGYVRADPRDPLAVERAIFAAVHLVGTFDKPRFIEFAAHLCAHSRSRITGCTRCLDLCPTGAIAPAGDHVAIDPHVCAGCGGCAAVCPTGAAGYALPPADVLLRRLRALLLTYRAAGGSGGVVLLHDGDHGEKLLHALARFGAGLPAHVLPARVNEVAQIGPEAVLAAFAYGAVGVQILARARPRHDTAALRRTVELADALLQGLGYGPADGAPSVAVIETDDPDGLRAALDTMSRGIPAAMPASFLPLGAKRNVLEFTVRELHRAAPLPVDVVPLAVGAPFGGLEIDAAGCTLCLACVSACPTQALGDDPERPLLRFAEALCVQCGLCAATCPEHVIRLKPQVDFAAWKAPARIVKQEEPFDCVACGKPFGTRASIERVIAKLRERHWMFAGRDGEDRLRMLMMCEDCRVEAVVNQGFDPQAGPPRPRPRTAEDYLRERAQGRAEGDDDDLA